MKQVLIPVITVVATIMAFWYAACVPMNIKFALMTAERQGEIVSPEGMMARRDMSALVLSVKNPAQWSDTWVQAKPRLPAPHQVVTELWKSTMEVKPTSKRSLVFHGWVTLSATLLGFVIGAGMGIVLAVGIVHSRAMDMSVMPWAIASQTIPILAIAPMIIVVLNSVGLQGLIPKAVISAYLSFFPVVVGMVKGLRSPSPMDLDLVKTWSATKAQSFWKLRLPASAPYLFASLKIGVASSLVGTIVGELPSGTGQGLGFRLLSGSYYGQTVQIWSALFATAILAACLVATIGAVERGVLKRMGLA
ncbi:NitT/TauT family transport system permease protein [Pseudooceanicola antarcticus]|uniref:ABC transporter permease n=1 Tax=Pseudooceanicola antarcticus TaxID=1247613 RepID=A0A285JBQ4_9RHOB|nr:ABC transporter permease [Pseudooceanicola antarcticus]PJE30868.1 ABC transporter permease [Pseudooceanicola antarcticus]SNY57523.1 NitT/TauT family transport system permease protein [Pseudooceanicola antarcticus]